ncbi:hypothetical protein KR200_008399 [Drosophila serrata]|nr:hypothetical protein KR200_008399 [Drosophila serrata]
MSGHHHYFGVLLLIYGGSFSYSYRLLDSQTCAAPMKMPLFEEQHLNDHRNFYNVHQVPRRNPSIVNEIKSENWLMRIINIKSIRHNPTQEDAGMEQKQHIDGWLKRFLNILNSKREEPSPKINNEPKILFLLKRNPYHREEHRIIKRDPLPNTFM